MQEHDTIDDTTTRAISMNDDDDNYYDNSLDHLPSSHPARSKELFGNSKNEGFQKRRGGWGEAMELAHTTTPTTTSGKTTNNSKNNIVVDLNQFRNTEIGRGYQAKHVVRQRTATAEESLMKIKTINNTIIDPMAIQEQKQKQKQREQFAATTITLDELLENDGLRVFRKEIEIILSSS